MRVSLVQMDIAFGNKQANFSKVHHLLQQGPASDIILLPELWSTGYDLTRAAELGEGETGLTVTFMQDLAKTNKAYVGGSILRKHPDGVGNTFVFVSPQGETLALYDKAHLFRLMQEDVYLSAGEQLTYVTTDLGAVGLAICYDLRFPEIFRRYADVPVDFTCLVAEWPLPRIEHWRTLIRARAIENQCFMFACNRIGKDHSNTFFGHSMIVDPWGEVVLEADDTEGVYSAEIDTSSIGAARARIPVLADRRKELY